MLLESIGPDFSSVPDGAAKLLIGGRMVAAQGGRSFVSTNPATEENVASVPDAGPEDVESAMEAARNAHKAWAARSYDERRKVVLAIADRLKHFAEPLGMLDTLENGNVLSAMRADAPYAAGRMEYLASIGYEVKGQSSNLANNLQYSRLQPYGVVLRLLPFNHPIASAGTALAAPLLMGNCVVLKPSPHTSLSALALGEAIADIVPPGVVTILSGSDVTLAEMLIRHPAVSRVSITGSVDAGKAVMRLAAERLTPLTLELGGKNPLIVFPDAAIDTAVRIAISGMNFKWQSHSCGSTSRILVHASLHDAFVEQLRAAMAGIRVSSPLDERAEMGAISFKSLYDRCRHYVESGTAEGARLVTGGVRPTGVDPVRGFFMTPALFDRVQPDMAIARDEIFGPVVSVLTWDDYDEMLHVANALDLGLTAVIVTDELTQALKTADALEVGYVEVNGSVSHALGGFFGGVKQSGIGREGGIDELISYTRSKSINIRL